MQYFPLFADLKGRAVLLVGAGEVATRKADSLLQAGADIRVVARELAPAFLDWQNEGHIQWLAREFQPEHLQDVFLVVSATGDAEVDSQVFKAAQARHPALGPDGAVYVLNASSLLRLRAGEGAASVIASVGEADAGAGGLWPPVGGGAKKNGGAGNEPTPPSFLRLISYAYDQ